jgi:hypothetical protein
VAALRLVVVDEGEASYHPALVVAALRLVVVDEGEAFSRHLHARCLPSKTSKKWHAQNKRVLCFRGEMMQHFNFLHIVHCLGD